MEFHHEHSIQLGELILEILKLRKLKFKNDKEKSEEAEEDYKRYSENLATEKQKQPFELNEEERAELKKKFRKATFLCHPDKVNDELVEEAQKIFVDLKNAYELNDLKKVSEILSELEKGNFKSKSETVTEKEKLKMAISKLKLQIKKLETEMFEIKESETYKTVVSINDWNIYFKETKEELEGELKELSKEVVG